MHSSVLDRVYELLAKEHKSCDQFEMQPVKNDPGDVVGFSLPSNLQISMFLATPGKQEKKRVL